MNIAYLNSVELSFFSDAQEQLEHLINELQSENYKTREHGDIEKYISKDGQELLRCLLQGWLDMKAADEERKSSIKTVDGEQLNHVRVKTTRKLTSLFGDVKVTRISYSQREHSSVFPMDANLNLPTDQYSDGIRHRVAKEALRGSFDDTIEVINETTGGFVPKAPKLKLSARCCTRL